MPIGNKTRYGSVRQTGTASGGIPSLEVNFRALVVGSVSLTIGARFYPFAFLNGVSRQKSAPPLKIREEIAGLYTLSIDTNESQGKYLITRWRGPI